MNLKSALLRRFCNPARYEQKIYFDYCRLSPKRRKFTYVESSDEDEPITGVYDNYGIEGNVFCYTLLKYLN